MEAESVASPRFSLWQQWRTMLAVFCPGGAEGDGAFVREDKEARGLVLLCFLACFNVQLFPFCCAPPRLPWMYERVARGLLSLLPLASVSIATTPFSPLPPVRARGGKMGAILRSFLVCGFYALTKGGPRRRESEGDPVVLRWPASLGWCPPPLLSHAPRRH